MRREGAGDFIYTISTEVSIVSVNSDSIIFGLDWLWHILLTGSIAFHELGCKMTWPKAKYTKRISAEKRIDVDLFRGVHILS
jgi:hypothetical protein